MSLLMRLNVILLRLCIMKEWVKICEWGKIIIKDFDVINDCMGRSMWYRLDIDKISIFNNIYSLYILINEIMWVFIFINEIMWYFCLYNFF